MADCVWKTVPADTDILNNANYEGGAAPGAGDNVYFVAGSGNVAGSDHHTLKLGKLFRGPLYTGSIGDNAGAPLWIGAAMVDLRSCGPSSSPGCGGTFLKGGDGTHKLDAVEIRPIDPSAVISIAGPIPAARATAGVLTTESGTIDKLVLESDPNLGSPGAAITYNNQGATITLLRQRSATSSQSSGVITAFEVDGGTLIFSGGSTGGGVQRAPGRVYYAASNNITTIEVYGETNFDASGAIRPFTITNLILGLGAGWKPGANVTLPNGIVSPSGAAVGSLAAAQSLAV